MDRNRLCCNVYACAHNVDGCECAKGRITITNCEDECTAHYCADYEE